MKQKSRESSMSLEETKVGRKDLIHIQILCYIQ